MILLMAGKDCPPEDAEGPDDCVPCIGPVAVLIPSGDPPQVKLKASSRVYASANPTDPSVG